MDPSIKVFQPSERDSFGQYSIAANNTHVFAFQVPMFGSMTITAHHILPNSQDFSIDIWLSRDILDGLVLGQGIGHFKAKRRAEKFEIFSSFLRQDDHDDRLFLDTHEPYFVNVKNLQNRQNAYELIFEPRESITGS
jgi:hypothetical protein